MLTRRQRRHSLVATSSRYLLDDFATHSGTVGTA